MISIINLNKELSEHKLYCNYKNCLLFYLKVSDPMLIPLP